MHKNSLSFWDFVHAMYCWNEGNYIDYRALETKDELIDHKTPEMLVVKFDLYKNLCEDSRWLLSVLCNRTFNKNTGKMGIVKFLIKNGWNKRKIEVVFCELEIFLSEMKEVQ